MNNYTEAERKMMAAMGLTEADFEPKHATEQSESGADEELREKVASLEEQLEAAKILLGVD